MSDIEYVKLKNTSSIYKKVKDLIRKAFAEDYENANYGLIKIGVEARSFLVKGKEYMDIKIPKTLFTKQSQEKLYSLGEIRGGHKTFRFQGTKEDRRYSIYLVARRY